MHTQIFSESYYDQEQAKSKITKAKDCKPDYIFVIQLHNGKFVVGQANNPAKRIASINSGYNQLVNGSLQVNCIVGIKEQNEDRSFAGVVRTFCERFGENSVIAV